MDQYDEDETGTYEEPKPKNGLRAQLEATLAKNEDLEKRLQAFEAEKRQRSLTEVLAAKGVHPKVASLIPAEVADAEGVDKWLAEYADAFGIKRATSDDAAPAENAAPAADPADVQGTKRLQGLASSAQAPDISADVARDFQAAQSTEEVLAAWQKARASFL